MNGSYIVCLHNLHCRRMCAGGMGFPQAADYSILGLVKSLQNSPSFKKYTVHGSGRARADPILLALDPGPPGSGQPQLAMARGQLGPVMYLTSKSLCFCHFRPLVTCGYFGLYLSNLISYRLDRK